jgi:hypothetical protein
MQIRSSHVLGIVIGLGVLGGAFWVGKRIQSAGERAQATLAQLSESRVEARRLKAAPTRDPARMMEEENHGSDPGEALAEVDAKELGLPESAARKYDSAYLYVAGRNEDPLADAGRRSPGGPAGTVNEVEMQQKEQLLLERFPELRAQVEKARISRKQAAELFEQRGGLSPEEWALKNGVHLEE